MSSAALQTAPHHSSSVETYSSTAASPSANRNYTSSSSAQARDGYYQQSAAPNASHRTSRRPSGNGASAPNNSQQQQYYSPNPNAVNAPRPANQDLTSSAGSSQTGFSSMAPGDHRSGVPPVVSPRTSSSRSAAVPTVDRSRGTRYTNEPTHSPRHATSGDGTQDRMDRQRSNGSTQQNGNAEDVNATRARRRAQQETVPHKPSGSREPRASQSASAVQRQAAGAPGGPSREASEVLNRVIVSKPEVDLDRERERMAEAIPSSPTSRAAPAGLDVERADDGARSGSRTRHDHSASAGKKEKHSKFGDYYLGNTLGEGEFGKVKMGWKQAGGVEVAIKLIRRDTVGTNPTRLAKIYREIAILREISHPNIVRLHEMVETEKQIGIILEYASGGELFDYILNHRYLKDPAARRLFAQLVSGVGYLHKKGIVHRDLKLENLLLDRNRNIIITDFGFANTFSANDELGEEIEYNLTNKEFVKRMELDKINLPSGHRRGDLMQTSCGSPCYAAPELVVSDSLYTGRKVDVWSCGVILYAMLAGYLPFDDDPANPEGDNINLLYKYIVSTTLTFPEYVTPHARDLLRRILVPDPRKRADLFEVARHSWLSEYSHVVGFITSPNTTSNDIGSTTISPEEQQETSMLNRSASVREPTKSTSKPTAAIGDLGRKHGNVDPEAMDHPKPNKDNKRRTVQVEYVAPKSQTQRGESSTAATSAPRTRVRAGSQGPVEVQASQPRRTVSTEKPLPRDPPGSRDGQYAEQRRGSTASRQQGMPPPSRPGRDPHRHTSESHAPPPVSIARPNTGGSMTSTGSRSGSLALRPGSYSQPAAPTVTSTNTQGRMAQPKTASQQYNIPISSTEPDLASYGIANANVPPKFAKVSGFPDQPVAQTPQSETKTHKRSNTIGSIFGRTNSFFGGRKNTESPTNDKPNKSYPPVSMSGAVKERHDGARPSMESRRSISFGFGKKRSGSIQGGSQQGGSQTTLEGKPRRFSLLPNSFSLKSIGIGKEYGTPGAPPSSYDDRPDSRGNYLDHTQSARDPGRRQSNATANQPYSSDGVYERRRDSPRQDRRGQNSTPPQSQSQQARYSSQQQPSSESRSNRQNVPPMSFRQSQGQDAALDSQSSLNEPVQQQRRGPYPPGFNETEEGYVNIDPPAQQQQSGGVGGRSNSKGVLQKPQRKFEDKYENEQGNGYKPTHSDHAGSSGAARKVMDFFRRRGRDRQ